MMRFTIHTGVHSSELHHSRKRRTELANVVEDIKSFLFDWTKLNVSVPPKQIPIHMGRNERGEVMDHIVMARKRSLATRPTNH